MTEEEYLYFMLDELRRSYEAAAKPYVDRLVQIQSMKLGPIYLYKSQLGELTLDNQPPT